MAAPDDLKTLQDVIAWGKTLSPKLEILDVVIQDEYTHDVIAKLGEGRYLCFDTT